MKKLWLLVILLLGVSDHIFAQQQLSPRVSAKSDIIEVSYGQPSKRSRVIFGDLVPYNEIWRAGANEATEITLKRNLKIGNKEVKAGTYTLFSIPKEKEWVIILNSQVGQWGAYDYDKNKNIAEITVPVYKITETREKLTYLIEKDALRIEWDDTGVAIPIK